MTTANYTNWFGLGDSACFGQTCTFGQFCSKDLLYQSCRSCEDMIAWCDVNVTHMKYVIPTCFYLCESREKERLQTELEGKPVLDYLHIILIALVAIFATSLVVTVVVPCVRRFWKHRKMQHQTTTAQNAGGNHNVNVAAASYTSLAASSMTINMPDQTPDAEDEITTDPKSPLLLPTSQTDPTYSREDDDIPSPPEPSAPPEDDVRSHTSDLTTSQSSVNTDATANSNDHDNDNDSGVVSTASTAAEAGDEGTPQQQQGSSVVPELNPPVPIQDGINNYSAEAAAKYPVVVMDETEKSHAVMATNLHGVGAEQDMLS